MFQTKGRSYLPLKKKANIGKDHLKEILHAALKRFDKAELLRQYDNGRLIEVICALLLKSKLFINTINLSKDDLEMLAALVAHEMGPIVQANKKEFEPVSFGFRFKEAYATRSQLSQGFDRRCIW